MVGMVDELKTPIVNSSGAAGSSGVAQNAAATYAAARLLVGTTTGDTLYVFGRTSQSDGGQGLFTWVAGGSTTINDGTQLSATGGIWQRTADQPTTPLMFGAKGDATGAGAGTDDATAVQAAANTGYCILPANKFFKTSSPIQVPNGGTFIGQSIRTSGLVGASVVGGVVQIGDGSTNTLRVTVGNFRVMGSGDYALKVNTATSLVIDSIFAGADVGEAFNPQWKKGGFYFDYTFGDKLTNFATNGAQIGSQISGAATFTASVGGATTGTLTASLANGKYNFKFSDGENRVVTITSGTTATWSVALLAGTITTAYHGASFWCGGTFNANQCGSWYTSDGPAYNFYMQDDNLVGGSNGNTFNNLTAQNGKQAIYVGGSYGTSTFNGFYSESVQSCIQIGDEITGKRAEGITFNSPVISVSGGIGNAAGVNVSYGSAVITGPGGKLFFGYGDTFAPVTITRGGGDTTGLKAYGVCIVNPAGIVIGISLFRAGFDYTATPTVSIGGSGSGATATATFGNVATFTGAISGTTLTVTGFDGRPIYPGITLTGGTVVAGTFVTAFISGTGGNGTYKVNASQTQSCTGASAITGLNLTAGGSGYGAGYAPILLGGSSSVGLGLTIIGPNAQPIGSADEGPLWPLVCASRVNAGYGSCQLLVIGDRDVWVSGDGAGNSVGCAVSTQRAYAVPPDIVLSSTYDFGGGCLVYRKYTLPVYP